MAGSATTQDSAENLRAVLGSIGRRTGGKRDSWFTRLVGAYLRYRFAQRSAQRSARRSAAPAREPRAQTERAHAVIRVACVKSALGGTASAAITTGAVFATAGAPSPLAGAVMTVPIAAVAIGGEMIGRALIHLDMVCDLAEIFGIEFDPEDPTEFWQIYGLAFGAADHEKAGDPGKDLVERLGRTHGKELGRKIGHEILGESVVKNLVPVLGIAMSPITNWLRTRKLGDTVRRYVRYRRAIGDAMAVAEDMCREHLDLLVAGLWFLFVADGQLNPEEAALLDRLLRKMDPTTRAKVEAGFVEDEDPWVAQLGVLPESMRDHFLHALEVAAAVDKSVSLPEQKILARAARALGRQYDRQNVEHMMKQFEDVGVLGPDPAPVETAGRPGA
jgi:hypothetical protein